MHMPVLFKKQYGIRPGKHLAMALCKPTKDIN